jgi:hypothetical protein
MTIFEPACGDGRMSDRLSIFGNRIISNDLYNYGYPHQDYQFDFLKDKHPTNDYDAIITNPPYDLIIEFISLAVGLTRAKKGMVCMLARHEFDATHSAMFDYPYCMKLILPRRPTWIDGKDIAAPRFPFAWYIYDWKSNYFDKPKTVWLDDSGRSIHARGLLA